MSYLKTFARGESDCTLRVGLSSLIKKNISSTRQSTLCLQFFKMLKLFLSSLNAIVVFFCMLYFILYHFQTFLIVLNLFLHLTHIYANSIQYNTTQ